MNMSALNIRFQSEAFRAFLPNLDPPTVVPRELAAPRGPTVLASGSPCRSAGVHPDVQDQRISAVSVLISDSGVQIQAALPSTSCLP